MLKLTNDPPVTPRPAVIDMGDMAPLDVGYIVDVETETHLGHMVLRTADSSKFEVMDLTSPGRDMCWDSIGSGTERVQLLEPGKVIQIDLFNNHTDR
jgi:hypothetical protein